MKMCFKCHQILSRSEFYPHRSMADGHLGKCKACTKADVKARYDRLMRDPSYVMKERERQRMKEAVKRGSRRVPLTTKPLTLARYYAKYPDRKTAHDLLGRAVRLGQISKPLHCSQCQRLTPRRLLHGHHDDYSKPLDVRWLCSACHGKHHRKPAPAAAA